MDSKRGEREERFGMSLVLRFSIIITHFPSKFVDTGKAVLLKKESEAKKKELIALRKEHGNIHTAKEELSKLEKEIETTKMVHRPMRLFFAFYIRS